MKYTNIFMPYNIFDLLCSIKPDFVMIHGLIGSISAFQVKKYKNKTNPKCGVIADIHQDYYNSPPLGLFKKPILQFIYRAQNKRMYPIYNKVYYVAPSCQKFAKEYYKVPNEKLELLPLGCDPEYINIENHDQISNSIRAKYNINSDDIVICHGGKMDEKKNTINLINAVKKLHISNDKIKLIIFGSFSEEYGKIIEPEIHQNSQFIKYAGILSAKEYCDIYMASDIAVFPGGQSVLWQQAIACGVAAVVKRHTVIEYLDLGGNIDFLDSGSTEEIYEMLISIINTGKHITMKKVAMEKGLEYFSYERIAKQVLDSNIGAKNEQ